MVFTWKWPAAILSSIVLGVTAGVTVPDLWNGETAAAQGQQRQQRQQPQPSPQPQQQSSFPDVEPNYWASPFIEGLAQEEIVVGYPDGTFRPTQNIERDEFSALIRQAFEITERRQISSGSAFEDVPENYWAATAIEDAYQGGFLDAFSNNQLFHPQGEMTRSEAITALAQGLQLVQVRPPATTAQAGDRPGTAGRARGPVARRQLAFPLGFTAMMQPLLLIQRANAQAPEEPAPSAEEPTQQSFVTEQPTPDLTAYYTDADRIPAEATDPILAATQANIVVNHPDPSRLNPNEFLSRGSAAALIYQSLVHAGRLEPLPENSPGNQYIVEPSLENQP